MEGIVVPASGRSGCFETVADLYAFDGSDREKGLSQQCVDFIEDRFAESGRKTVGDTFNDPAAGIIFLHQ